MKTESMPIRWIAHRGDMSHHPENTLISLAFALKNSTDAIEFDIQMNTDNDFIVIHDDNFQRTSGIRKSVLNINTKDLNNISVHEPKKYGSTYYPILAPLLQDALALLSKYPNAKAFIEIKEESLGHWGIDKVMNNLFKILKKYQQQVIIISFNYAAIAYTQKHSNLAHGWVLKKYDSTHREKALALNPDFLICNYQKIPDFALRWKGSWEWVLYDIQNQETAETLSLLGVKWIETGDISKMLTSKFHE